MNLQEKLQEIKQHAAKAQEIRSMQNITSIASELKKMVADEQRKIEADTMLSPEGKRAKLGEVKKQLGKQFIDIARQQKEEYQQSVVKVKVGAETLLNEDPPKPSPISIKTFERELADLKMQIMLSTRYDESIRSLQSFAAKHSDPYYASQLKQQFAEIAPHVIASAGADAGKAKNDLRQAFETLKSAALTPEQKEAAQLHEQFADAFSAEIFPSQSIQLDAIRDSVGDQFAKYANRPEYFPDEDSTVNTKNGGNK